MLVRNALLCAAVAVVSGFSLSGSRASDNPPSSHAPVQVAVAGRYRTVRSTAKVPPLPAGSDLGKLGPQSNDTRALGVISPIACEIVGGPSAANAARAARPVDPRSARTTQAPPYPSARGARAYAVLTFAVQDGFQYDNTRVKLLRYSDQPPTPDSQPYTPAATRPGHAQDAIGYCVANDEWFAFGEQEGIRLHLFRQHGDIYAKIPYCYSSATVRLTPVPGFPTEYRLVIPIEVTTAAAWYSRYGLVAYRQLDHNAYAVGTTEVTGK